MATGLTAFSLGNFVSNQQQANTDGGMVLRLNITKAGNMPATVVPEVFYAWTHKPMENGVKQYYIVPSYDADTILSEDPGAKQRYHKFVSSARNIIGSDPAIKELMGFAVKQRYAPIATPHIFEGYVYPLRHEADTLLPPNVSAANR